MNNIIENLKKQFDVLGVIDLGQWDENDYEKSQEWLTETLALMNKDSYDVNQRLVFLHTKDLYVNKDPAGLILKNLQLELNKQDITSCFVLLLSTNLDIQAEINIANEINTDNNIMSCIHVPGEWKFTILDQLPYSEQDVYQYGSANPIKINLKDISERKKFLLSKSKKFCIYPWIHLHAYPTGEAYPCCHAEMAVGSIGSTHTNSLKELWNSNKMRKLRTDMLEETPNSYCSRCYEQEESGFFGGRQSANKHHGHHIDRIDSTAPNGTLEQFEMTYWDIRFSNLCNLKCRSCGHIFSSQWYQDQAKLAGPDWAKKHKVLNIAGRSENDMWEQLIPHLDYVEQIYFAGGEPLLMDEHYNILDELERRGRFDVRLIYNTNFTEIKLKDRLVFDYWKKFKSVAVGASLDAMGPQGEYIRKGTKWANVEYNREKMLEVCPEVDFYISPTLSILNAWHLPDFHRNWVDRGLIKPQDLNVNVLQDPAFYRVDIAPMEFKLQLQEKFNEHLAWLRPLDKLNRATQGFESVINFMMATDNTHLLDTFWRKTYELDAIRNENIIDVLPELRAIK
jgi:MoaA/NifB/PqqE/SkfB family radical SAM enzyme